MNFESFKKDFFINLKNNNNNCFKLIENNQKLIQEYLTEKSNEKNVDIFVNEIIDTLLENKINFKFIEKVLKNENLNYVFSVFKKREALIKACKYEKIDIAKWLITLDMDPCVQDEEGMTAMMYAAKNKKLIDVVSKYKNDSLCCNLEDKNGNNALFHSVQNLQALLQLINSVDINHLNKQHETVLLYCCKNEIYEPLKTLINRQGIDLSIVDKESKTALMYLVENEREKEINDISVVQLGNNFNYINDNGESAISIFVRKMYRKDGQEEKKVDYTKMANILVSFVKSEVDFNIIVDEDGNTALMVFLIARDINTFKFVLRYSKDLDFSQKNIYGENATSLFFKTNGTSPYEKMLVERHSSIDYNFIDPVTNDTVLMLAIRNNSSLIDDIIKNSNGSINNINSSKESALVLAAKTNNVNCVKILLTQNINVNQQDNTGNTALHYAVGNEDIAMVQDLKEHGADINIKNNENMSPYEMAKTSKNQNLLKAITDSLSTPPELGKTVTGKVSNSSKLNNYSDNTLSKFYIEMEYKGEIQNIISKVYDKYNDYIRKENESEKRILYSKYCC